MPSTIIYGINPVIEALKARLRRCHCIYIYEGRRRADAEKVAALGQEQGIEIKYLPGGELDRLAGTDKSQGVAARVDPYPYSTLEGVLALAEDDPQKGFLLALDGILDPQNLGSLIRTAHQMGVHGVIIPKDRSAGVTAAVVKASAGATEHTEIVQVVNLTRTLITVKGKGFWISGAEAQGGYSLFKHSFKGGGVVIVMGSEGKGLSRLVREHCDHLLFIPMSGKIDSLNVSAAGAIFLAEVARQRGA